MIDFRKEEMVIETGKASCPFCNKEFVVGLNRQTGEIIEPERCCHFRDTKKR